MKWILGVIGVICILGVVAGFIIDKLGPTLEEEEEEVAPTAEIETESTPVEETETPSAPQTIEELFSDADNAEISEDNEIGRASCRERVEISEGAVVLT